MSEKEILDNAIELLKPFKINSSEFVHIFKINFSGDIDSDFRLIQRSVGNGETRWCITRDKRYLDYYFECGRGVIYIIITPSVEPYRFKIVGVRADNGQVYDRLGYYLHFTEKKDSLYDYLQSIVDLNLKNKETFTQRNEISEFLRKHVIIKDNPLV